MTQTLNITCDKVIKYNKLSDMKYGWFGEIVGNCEESKFYKGYVVFRATGGYYIPSTGGYFEEKLGGWDVKIPNKVDLLLTFN